jgi:FKBP-type peptidyl-prolyl cis-trans isomerase SlyD
MQAAKDTVVVIHYLLHVDGTQVENSRDGDQPLHVLLGHGQLIPGLEKAIEGRAAGDMFSIELAPDEAYGERKDNAIQRVPKKYFHNGARLKPGMTTVLALREGGQRAVTVHKVGMSTVDVDTNHPMAGKTLNFDVEIVEVREPSAEELQHGHAHGPQTPAH